MGRSNSLRRTLLLATLLVIGCDSRSQATAEDKRSVYSDLSETTCKTLEVDEQSGYSKQRCEGSGKFSLIVEEQDGRASITVVRPDKREIPLDVPGKIGSGFTTLGPRAEWRRVDSTADSAVGALIYRVIEQPDSDGESKRPQSKSWLVVVKITDATICTVAVVEPGAKQNQVARSKADNAGDCIK